MSIETLTLLRTLLASQRLNVGAEDFARTAQQVATALAELDQAIAELKETP